MSSHSRWLIAGGVLSAGAALLHLGVIIGGPDWYRWFGAGEQMALMAERGSPVPALVTTAVAVVLAICSAYAFAGAGLIRRLPLMRTALVVISAIYLIRGVAAVPLVALNLESPSPFVVWSSLITLIYGIVHSGGTWQAWPRLSQRSVHGYAS